MTYRQGDTTTKLSPLSQHLCMWVARAIGTKRRTTVVAKLWFTARQIAVRKLGTSCIDIFKLNDYTHIKDET